MFTQSFSHVDSGTDSIFSMGISAVVHMAWIYSDMSLMALAIRASDSYLMYAYGQLYTCSKLNRVIMEGRLASRMCNLERSCKTEVFQQEHDG